MNEPASDRHADANSSGSEQSTLLSDCGAVVFKLLKPVASWQLTVFVFVLGMILVFYGTLAQIDQGIFTVLEKYFKSWIVWIPFQLNAEFAYTFCGLDRNTQWPGSFPFPGGVSIASLMLLNLLAAHTV